MSGRVSDWKSACAVLALFMYTGTLLGQTSRTRGYATTASALLSGCEETCDLSGGGFSLTWTADPGELLESLVNLQGLPAGVVGLTATIQVLEAGSPASIQPCESTGFYSDFPFDGALSIPDGIILSTGVLGKCVSAASYEGYHGVNGTPDTVPANLEPSFEGAFGHDGDAGIQAMYNDPPPAEDGVALTLAFTTDSTIRAMWFQVVLASEEFPEYTPEDPTPRDKADQPIITCYPDTFGAFFDDEPIGFTRTSEGQEILINVAPGVMKYNNGADLSERHCTGNLSEYQFPSVTLPQFHTRPGIPRCRRRGIPGRNSMGGLKTPAHPPTAAHGPSHRAHHRVESRG